MASHALAFMLCLGNTMAQEGGEMMIEHKKQHHASIVTHGVIMGLAFAIVFPLGAILIRVASFRGLVWVHAAIQSLAYAMALVGLGLGIYIAVYPESQYMADNGHPIIGTVVIAALYLQPMLALLHHNLYKKEGKRTIWAMIHVWWGRVIVTLGIINGGLGLMLSGNTTKGEIAYGVIAAVMWLTWMGVSAASFFRSSGVQGETGEKLGKSKEANDSDASP